MFMFRLCSILTLAGGLLLSLPARSAPPEPEKSNPAPADHLKDTTPGDEPNKPFFKPEAAFPGANALGFRPLRLAPIGSFGAPGPQFLPADGLGLFAFNPGSDLWSIPSDSYISVPTLSPLQQALYNQQAYNAWQQWKNAQASTGPSIWLPGMGSSSQGDSCTPIAHIAMLYAPMYGLSRQPGRPAFIPTNCFVSGTLVSLAEPANSLRSIDAIHVGERVRADRSTDDRVEIAPLAWRRLELRAARRDGSFTRIVLLRPNEWLEERDSQVGSKIPLAIPECGFDGLAEVLAIDPCPPIQPGQGCIVTGILQHESAAIVNMHIEGLAEPIGTTANHRFWSEDRQDFIRADELRTGERLRGLCGACPFIRLEPRSSPEPVFNLEVLGSGAYRVSPLGLLARDAGTGLNAAQR